MVSVLIIGCGSIGERHLRCFRQTGRAAVTACDSNPVLLQRMAATYQVAAVADARTALREPFDAAVICTPAPSHVSLARLALEQAKHVLIEKPLSLSLEGLEQLQDLQAQSGRQAAVAYVYHAFPVLIAAKGLLASGELGPVRQATVTAGQAFHRLRPGYAATYYQDRATGGGAIQDALTHLTNWVESVLGPADSLFCDCAHLSLPNVSVEDTVHVAARHGDCLVSYSLNQFQAPNEISLQFNTDTASLRIELHQHRWGLFRHGQNEWTWYESPVLERDAHFTAQANAFLDQIAGAPARLCSLAAATQSVRFNLAALTSAERGTRVFCGDLR